jgi:stage V sporulation protein B
VSAPLLSALGLSVVSSCLIGVTNSVLQAHRRVVFPIASMALGTLVKVVTAYVLLGIPEIGIMGAPLSTLLCNTVSVAMNLYFIEKCRAISGHLYGTLFRPFGASLMAILVSLGIYLPFSTRVSTVLSFLIAALACAACYFPLASAFGALQAEDVALLPMGDRIAKALQTNLKKSEQKKKGNSNGKQTGDQRAAEKGKILF